MRMTNAGAQMRQRTPRVVLRPFSPSRSRNPGLPGRAGDSAPARAMRISISLRRAAEAWRRRRREGSPRRRDRRRSAPLRAEKSPPAHAARWRNRNGRRAGNSPAICASARKSSIEDLISTMVIMPSSASATRSARRPERSVTSGISASPSARSRRQTPRRMASARSDWRPSGGSAGGSSPKSGSCRAKPDGHVLYRLCSRRYWLKSAGEGSRSRDSQS